MSQHTSDFLAQWLAVVGTLAGIAAGAWFARRSNCRAKHWREVEARQRREREAANAPAFCQHCSALIPKMAGIVRYCQRCGKSHGDAPELTPGRVFRLPPGWDAQQVQPVKPARERPAYWAEGDRVPCDVCKRSAWFRIAGERPGTYHCDHCGNVAVVPGEQPPTSDKQPACCPKCLAIDWELIAGNLYLCRACGDQFRYERPAFQPVKPAAEPGRFYNGINCPGCGSPDYDREIGNARRCRSCGKAFTVPPDWD
jgi:ribosomal protein L37AE/L43A